MNIFKKALIVALSIGLISVPSVTKEVEAASDRYIAGSFQGWNAGSTKMTWNESKSRYEVTYSLSASTSYSFKFTDGTWNNNWGTGGTKGGSDITFTSTVAGNYLFWWAGDSNASSYAVNCCEETRVYFSNTSKWSNVYYYSWSILGDWKIDGEWPGKKIEKVANGDNVYYVDTYKGTNAVFNSNSGSQTSDLSTPSTSNSMYTLSTKKWTTYKEHSIIYIDGTNEGNNYVEKNKLEHNVNTSVTLSKNLEKDGFNLIGWSTTNDNTVDYEYEKAYSFNKNEDLKLYAVWEEKAAVQYDVTFVVNGQEYSVIALEGQTVEEIIPTEKIETTDVKVVGWDKSGVVTSDVTVTATKYYTTIEKTEAQLGFDYSFTTITRVWFQVNSTTDPIVWAQIGDDASTGLDFPMTFEKESDGKKQYYCDIPLEYNKIQFKFGDDHNTQYPNGFVADRNYIETAHWYDSAESNGSYPMAEYSTASITSVDNVALRLSTPEVKHSDFMGVTSYGIDVTVNGKTLSSTNEYIVGASTFEWDTVLYNIDSENFNTNISFVAWVKIDGNQYNLSDVRTETVVTLAKEYTTKTELSNIQKAACQYIVDTYEAK